MKWLGARGWRAALLGAACVLAVSGLQAGILSAPAAAQAPAQQITDCSSEYGTDGAAGNLVQGTLAYAVAQGGTWTFACSGTIHITSTLYVLLGQTVALLSGGQAVTLDGDTNGTKTEIFVVSRTGSLTLDGLTLENSAGSSSFGAILSDGTLTVSDSTFRGNSAPGQTISGTIEGADGGAIFSAGTLTVSNSTFSGNSAPFAGAGGAIFSAGTLTVSNSTFSGNSVPHYGVGGAIFVNSGTAMVSNSTFSGNSAPYSGAGGAIFTSGAALTVSNSTFSGNSAPSGANLAGGGTLTNTIVANPGGGGGNCAGTFSGEGNLAYGDGSCGTAGWTSGNPDLGSLAPNGGPTETMALGAGSAALGAGDPAYCAGSPVNGFDQRGVARGTTMATCDIGAYQATPPSAGDLAAAYVAQPSPIAPPGTLVPGQTVALTVSTETYSGNRAPNVPLYLSLSGGTGSASVDGVSLGATPKLFISDANGSVPVQYTAGTAPAGGATDTLTVADAPLSPALQTSDNYSYAITLAGLAALTQQLETQPGIAAALSAKLDAAAAAAAHGDTHAVDGALGAFENQVRAQAGKTLTAQQAATLTQDAQSLMQ